MTWIRYWRPISGLRVLRLGITWHIIRHLDGIGPTYYRIWCLLLLGCVNMMDAHNLYKPNDTITAGSYNSRGLSDNRKHVTEDLLSFSDILLLHEH